MINYLIRSVTLLRREPRTVTQNIPHTTHKIIETHTTADPRTDRHIKPTTET